MLVFFNLRTLQIQWAEVRLAEKRGPACVQHLLSNRLPQVFLAFCAFGALARWRQSRRIPRRQVVPVPFVAFAG